MRTHHFIESTSAEEYKRAIFCQKCGKIAWYYNWSAKLNEEWQKKIGECIEQDTIQPVPNR